LKKPDRETLQQVEFLNIINEEADRLTRLINDILNVTKIEERRIDIQRKPVDLYDIIERSISAHRSHGQKKNIRIETDVKKSIPKAWGDRDTLMQVLANLLNNAVKYTPEGGEIRVSAERSHQNPHPPGEIEVRVKDDGIGIPTKYLSQVFERFYRIDRLVPGNETGTGLGLYFCKYIVEMHGGRIWAESDETKGSTFVFTLPIAEKSDILEKSDDDIQTGAFLGCPMELRHRISVLIVDDEVKIRNFLKYYLQEEGLTVYEAESGSKAIELARKKRPNLILLDAVMPAMDGYEVLEALAGDEATKNIPVIVLSGGESSDVAINLGAADYLVKPIARSTLLETVDQVLIRAVSS
jgi:CheY-like chemotaxis protein